MRQLWKSEPRRLLSKKLGLADPDLADLGLEKPD